MNKPKIHGYTTILTGEATKLPFAETLLSWSRLCDKIFICYSSFPKLDYEIPEGAVCPWEEDGTRDVLEKLNETILKDKIVIVDHEWDPNNPGEDGVTKQIARQAAQDALDDDPDAWLAQFDGDEVLREDDAIKLIQMVSEDNEIKEMHLRHPFIITGILELFGGPNQVRFKFGNWLKIRLTRNIKELQHGMPLRLGNLPVRGRHPETGKIISIDNRDDGAGFISNLSLTRPDYNAGLLANDPHSFNRLLEMNQLPDDSPGWLQAALHLQGDLDSGVWIYHTGWLDIPRKWSMGWFFDNFWSVLSGKQATFTEKADKDGKFTRTTAKDPEKDLETELQRNTIKQIPGLEIPEVFKTIYDWRENHGIMNPIPGVNYERL